MKITKKFSAVLFALIWLLQTIVLGITHVFVMVEYNFFAYGFITGILYLISFWFFTYKHSESKLLFILYTIYASFVFITHLFVTMFGDKISEGIVEIITFVPKWLFISTLAAPTFCVINFWDRTGHSYILVILMFYAVYFVSRFIKKRMQKKENFENTTTYPKNTAVFNWATVILFIINSYLTFPTNNKPFSIISCVLFLICFIISLWLNSYNKIFLIIKWCILVVAMIPFILIESGINFSDWIIKALYYTLRIPYIGIAALSREFTSTSMSESKAGYICLGGFLLVCLVISIVQEILKYKRNDDENKKPKKVRNIG